MRKGECRRYQPLLSLYGIPCRRRENTIKQRFHKILSGGENHEYRSRVSFFPRYGRQSPGQFRGAYDVYSDASSHRRYSRVVWLAQRGVEVDQTDAKSPGGVVVEEET